MEGAAIVFTKFPHELRERTVLMVEDDKGAWANIGNAFKYFGMRKLVLAESGATAKKLLDELLAQGRGVPFDLVVCDLHQPGMTTLDLVRHIREHAALRHLPVMVLSENATVATVQELSRLGISAFLLKPISPTDLAEKVSEVLLPLAARKDQAAG
ncbi:MAG: response regulator [Candidatus Tectomicrobia bacterium]|uniref:Response regulator n=1 Tax=Tectimicrobiota bacterium TaxID=2528274 RepID=A0A932HYF0_UNCTE|nr:response regulator [Candidatus Tectomicrobia bacterium]